MNNFHGLENYSFFFPLHCSVRRVCVINWRVKEEYQSMFSSPEKALSRKLHQFKEKQKLFLYLFVPFSLFSSFL
jgi:hypothetical protein